MGYTTRLLGAPIKFREISDSLFSFKINYCDFRVKNMVHIFFIQYNLGLENKQCIAENIYILKVDTI